MSLPAEIETLQQKVDAKEALSREEQIIYRMHMLGMTRNEAERSIFVTKNSGKENAKGETVLYD